jgi:hypothetical protein
MDGESKARGDDDDGGSWLGMKVRQRKTNKDPSVVRTSFTREEVKRFVDSRAAHSRVISLTSHIKNVDVSRSKYIGNVE